MKSILKSIFSILYFGSMSTVSAQAPEHAENICPLLVGGSIPNADLIDSEGQQIVLKELFKHKPTILVFYRGGWCPYCNMQLSGLAKVENEILHLGYQIVAISPDDYQNLKFTAGKDSINYTLLSDPNGNFIRQIGIAFTTPTMLKGFIAAKGQKGKTSEIMPVPAVFVVSQESKILFEYINPNYKERIAGEMLLAVLKSMNK